MKKDKDNVKFKVCNLVIMDQSRVVGTFRFKTTAV